MLWIGREIWELLEYAALYKRGLAPVAGGALDQAESFLAGCRLIWSLQARYKAEAGKMDE